MVAYAGSQFKADGLHVGIDVLDDFFAPFRGENAEVGARTLISGLMRTALTEISIPGIDLVCNRKMSLNSFWSKRAILFCLVVSILYRFLI